MIDQGWGRLPLDAYHPTVGMVVIGIEPGDPTVLDRRYCGALRRAQGAIPAKGIGIR